MSGSDGSDGSDGSPIDGMGRFNVGRVIPGIAGISGRDGRDGSDGSPIDGIGRFKVGNGGRAHLDIAHSVFETRESSAPTRGTRGGKVTPGMPMFPTN